MARASGFGKRGGGLFAVRIVRASTQARNRVSAVLALALCVACASGDAGDSRVEARGAERSAALIQSGAALAAPTPPPEPNWLNVLSDKLEATQ